VVTCIIGTLSARWILDVSCIVDPRVKTDSPLI